MSEHKPPPAIPPDDNPEYYAVNQDVKLRNLKGATVRIKVQLTKEYRVRVWLALLCFRLGAWVSGMSIEVNYGETKEV